MKIQPDYELEEVLELTTPEQLKALGDVFRQKILRLLLDQSATTNQLAEALGSPTSTTAHHLNVLTDAGLTQIVRTRQVRAITERYYGCTARTYISISSTPDTDREPGIQLLQQMLKEVASSQDRNRFLSYTTGHTRIPLEKAQAFMERINQFVQEFEAMNIPGEQTFNLFTALYQMNVPELPIDRQEDTREGT